MDQNTNHTDSLSMTVYVVFSDVDQFLRMIERLHSIKANIPNVTLRRDEPGFVPVSFSEKVAPDCKVQTSDNKNESLVLDGTKLTQSIDIYQMKVPFLRTDQLCHVTFGVLHDSDDLSYFFQIDKQSGIVTVDPSIAQEFLTKNVSNMAVTLYAHVSETDDFHYITLIVSLIYNNSPFFTRKNLLFNIRKIDFTVIPTSSDINTII